MSAFSSLSVFWQTVIPLLLFCEAVLELGLFLYQTIRSRMPLRSLPCAVHFVILLTLLLSVTRGDPYEGKDAFLLGAPWLIFAAVIVLAALHFAIAFPRVPLWQLYFSVLDQRGDRQAPDGYLLRRPGRAHDPVQQPYAPPVVCAERSRAADCKGSGGCVGTAR